jgi:hypothetical protein
VEATKRIVYAAAVAVCVAYLAANVLAIHNRMRDERESAACGQNIGILTRAISAYCADHRGAFPPAPKWCDALLPYVHDRSVFVCPAARNQECSYAYNSVVGHIKLDRSENAANLVALFESDAGWNAAGGPELLPDRPRHHSGRGEYVGCANGSTGFESRSRGPGSGDKRWLKQYLEIGHRVDWSPRLVDEAGE